MFQNNLLMGAASISAGGITVDNSVRYNDDDSPRLYRTPSSAGNQLAGSISLWYKRCNLGSIMQLFNAGAGDDITFNANDKLTFTDSSGVSYITTQVFRDPTAWGHLLFAWDTTLATAGDRLRIYHNGVEITAFDTETNPSQNDQFEISNTVRQTIGANESDTEEFDGYLSQVYLVDGEQLTPSSFGEFTTTNVWRPIEFSPSAAGTGTISWTATDSEGTGASAYTFSSQAIGTASATRRIYIGLGAEGPSTFNDDDLTSVTVGGVTATTVADEHINVENHMWILSADVPTGTTADVVVTFSVTTYNCCIGLWAADSSSTSLWDFGVHNSTDPLTTTINVPAGGWALAFAVGAGGPYTWTGLSEDFDAAAGDTRECSGASTAFASNQSDLTVTADHSTAAGSGLIAIAVGPADNNYGPNGIFLDFADSSDFGNDESGNNNDYTSSGLAADDQFPDTPTKNWCTFSSVGTRASSLVNGGLKVDVAPNGSAATTISVTSGKWYMEFTMNGGTSNERACYISQNNSKFMTANIHGDGGAAVGNFVGYWSYNGNIIDPDSVYPGRAYGDTYSDGDVISLALDLDNNAVWFAKNGTWQDSATEAEIEAADTSNAAAASLPAGTWFFVYSGGFDGTGNFGQSDYAHSVPDGFLDVNTANLPIPTILDGTANFQNTLYTGDGSTRNIDQTGNSTFQPDWVWIKNRSQADSNMLFDAPRGVTKVIHSNNNVVTSTDANSLTSFDSDGFGLGTGAGGYNDNTESFVAWQWLAGGGAGSSNEAGSINTTTTTVNTTAGISISTYVGTGSVATVGHGLGAVPDMMVVRNVAQLENWRVYHKGNTSAPETEYLSWANDSATADLDTTWNDTAPTSTVFTVGTSAATNQSGETMVAYCFAEIEGFSRFGAYMGANAGALAFTGFKPAYVMIKKTSGTGNWVMYDNKRSPYNEVDDQLLANTTAAETTGSEEIDFLANGFKCRTTDSDINTNLALYVFAAFAEYPFGGEDVTPSTSF